MLWPTRCPLPLNFNLSHLNALIFLDHIFSKIEWLYCQISMVRNYWFLGTISVQCFWGMCKFRKVTYIWLKFCKVTYILCKVTYYGLTFDMYECIYYYIKKCQRCLCETTCICTQDNKTNFEWVFVYL